MWGLFCFQFRFNVQKYKKNFKLAWFIKYFNYLCTRKY